MIYTSYFAKYKGENGISIARFKPKWFTGSTYLDLAPSKELLYWWKSCEQGDYEKYVYYCRYMGELSKLDPHKVAKDLDGRVLLCYEKSNEFCHRHLVADWLKSYGYECEELEL